METKTYKVYKFDELSKEQKEKAIENYRDINVDYDWWDYVPYDYDIDLIEFDLYRHEIKIKFKTSAKDTAEYIIENYGKTSDVYNLATIFLKEVKPLYKKYDDDIEGDELENEQKIEEVENEFNYDLKHLIFKELQSEYDYRMSDESIIETFECNDYDFTTTGKID